MTLDTPLAAGPGALKQRFSDLVLLPGDAGFDEANSPWDLSALQQPAAVAVPRTPDDVAAIVRAAVEAGLRIAPQGTGHGATPLARRDLTDAVLLRTTALTDVAINPERRVARVGSGAMWDQVVSAAAPHGLTALHGSSPDVGVAGYSLGGGIGWYARKHGLAADSILAVELVTADGREVRADAESNPDLFWALRGGGGNFGVVTALELRLFEIPDAYAGIMLWPLTRAENVLREWVDWTRAAPEEVTTSLRFMRIPPLPFLPDFLRGRELVVLDGAALGDDAFGAEQFARLRALDPEIDTFGGMPAAAITRLHMDPEEPSAAIGNSLTLGELDAEAQRTLLSLVGPGARSSLVFAELRQLGGALARRSESAGALGSLRGQYAGFFMGMGVTPEMAAAAEADAAAIVLAMAPWAAGGCYLNFADEELDPRNGFDEQSWDRLRRVRAEWDPREVFVANHLIPAA
ncbi:FAD-binding oxidoreductase [Herbiconiux sp. SYSU D00978]|uniref:FAD-binding oxidoreductase n=1 Tax=Herbiconiux sp. SYSU D00978 TaxID=2812562 RepID=UPI001A9777E6|nr:FAD-binding oxidoreductase [Herbiconiux sp. SYSU D00978]